MRCKQDDERNEIPSKSREILLKRYLQGVESLPKEEEP
jgi:hypothetical protein